MKINKRNFDINEKAFESALMERAELGGVAYLAKNGKYMANLSVSTFTNKLYQKFLKQSVEVFTEKLEQGEDPSKCAHMLFLAGLDVGIQLAEEAAAKEAVNV